MNSQTKRFLWGVATSSYQVEGGITNNDWNYYTSSEMIKKRVSNLTRSSIFYRRNNVSLEPAEDGVTEWNPEYYDKDFENASQLGMNTF